MADIMDIYQWLEDDATYKRCSAFFKTTDKSSLMVSISSLNVPNKDELLKIVNAPLSKDEVIYNVLVLMARKLSKSKYIEYFALKGGLVLVTLIRNKGCNELLRRTTDMDIHCTSKDKWDLFCSECEGLFNDNIEGYTFKLIKRRNDLKPSDVTDSLRFSISHALHETFTLDIDMNVKSNDIVELEFNNSLGLNAYTVPSMLADKLNVIADYSLHRRIKDLYDLYAFITMYDLSFLDISDAYSKKYGKKLSELQSITVPANMESLSHAYEMYKGIMNKPDFTKLLSLCNAFISPLFEGLLNEKHIWECDRRIWVEY